MMAANTRATQPLPRQGDLDDLGWACECLRVTGALCKVTRHLADDAEGSAIRLYFADGVEQVIRPARLVVTQRLADVVGALGYDVPRYAPGDIAKVGQALSRAATARLEDEAGASKQETASVLAAWLVECAKRPCYVLWSRDGKAVRAAIEHAREDWSTRVSLIAEPRLRVTGEADHRVEGALLVYSVAARRMLKDRLDLKASEIGEQLESLAIHLNSRGLAARPAPTEPPGTVELPVYVVPNGWRGVGVEMPTTTGESGVYQLPPFGGVRDS